jgi:predicted dienelactone hydrolase
MTWVKRLAALLAIAVVAFLAYAVVTARRSGNPVGFQVAQVNSPVGPVAVAIWYPTSGTPRPTTFVGGSLLSVAPGGPIQGDHRPVVVISHGNGGSALSHVDLAMDLASAGYVVAAPTHAGDNYADQSHQGSADLFYERAEQVRSTVDYLLKAWPGASRVDSNRIGVYGMSAGAFTVLTLVGGVPRMAIIPEHCRENPEFICKALARSRSPLLAGAKGSPASGQIRASRRRSSPPQDLVSPLRGKAWPTFGCPCRSGAAAATTPFRSPPTRWLYKPVWAAWPRPTGSRTQATSLSWRPAAFSIHQRCAPTLTGSTGKPHIRR